LLHGGASCVWLNNGSVASALVIDQSKSILRGLEINANHIRSAKSGFVTGVASLFILAHPPTCGILRSMMNGEKMVVQPSYCSCFGNASLKHINDRCKTLFEIFFISACGTHFIS